MKNVTVIAAIGAALLAVGAPAQAAGKSCLPIGGTALGKIFDGNQIMAATSGTWSGVRGVIKSQTKTAAGLDLKMQHVYATATGGILKTRDTARFTAVPGKDKTYMVEIAYTIVSSQGSLAGYRGTFYSFGLIKAGEGEVVVRYSGRICK